MPRIYPLALILSLFATSPVVAVHYNVFLVAGQSNAEGTDFNNPTTTTAGGYQEAPILPGDTNLLHFPSTNLVPRTDPWATMAPARHSVLGPERGLARRLAANGWTHVAVIKFARGGTSIRQWTKGSPYDVVFAGVTYNLYENFILHTQSGLAKLEAMNGGGNTWTIRGFTWMQGEADVSSPSEGSLYAERLHSLVTDLRTDLGAGDAMRLVVGRTSITQPLNNPSVTDGMTRVRLAQQTVSDGTHATYPLANGAWINVDDIAQAPVGAVLDGVTLPRGGLRDSQHFTLDGYAILGARWADKFGLFLSAWTTRNLGARPLADQSPTADPDGDGLNNLLEFASRLDPLAPHAPGTSGAPLVEPIDVAGARHLQLTYTENLDARGLVYRPEVSSDLITWQSGAGFVVPVSASTTGAARTVRVRDAQPISPAAPRRFLRLNVTAE